MPLSKAHPLRDIHASHSRKLTISVLAIPYPSRVSFSLPCSYFRLCSFIFFLFFSFIFLLFSVPVTFAREATPSRHERFHGTNSVFLLRGYLFRFRSSAVHAIPCQSQGSARLNATSRYESTKKSACKMWNASSPSTTPEQNERAQEIARSDLRTLDDQTLDLSLKT